MDAVNSTAILQRAFDELAAFVARYDPISLLSQLTLTFLFVPENEFQREDSDVFTWQRQIEFLAGYVIVRSDPPKRAEWLDGEALAGLDTLLRQYFNEVTKHLVFESATTPETHEKDLVLAEAKIESLYVRGDAYPHQLYEFAQGLYGPHDDWFRKRYGFTIDEGIHLAKAIGDMYGDRCDTSRNETRIQARLKANELIVNGRASEDERGNLEGGIACQLLFGHAEDVLGFSVEELATFSGVAMHTCQCFLDRMSQGFGYRNPSFPKSFTDPVKAAWDYNTLNERPLITRDGKYWALVPPVLASAMLTTFYFDLMRDTSYRPVFEKARGSYVERRTAECLRLLFPPDATLLNPKYLNGDEMTDVMVLYDHKILIVQCKSKTLTYFARIGADFDALRKDLEEAIGDAFQQGIKAREYLEANRVARFTAEGQRFELDMDQVNDIYLVSVTAMPFQTLAARLANTNSALKLFPDNEYPWSLSLGDLDMVTRVLSTPAQFLHYAVRRKEVEATPFRLHADEMDYLGFYLSHGMRFDDDEFKGMDSVGLSGFSDDIDRWVFNKFELGHQVDPPRSEMPDAFSAFLRDIELTGDDYRTDCAIALLDLSSSGREQLMEIINQTKALSTQDEGLHSCSLIVRGGKRGFSFVSFSAKGDKGQLLQQAVGFAIVKKYDSRCDEWIGFGWDIASSQMVDLTYFISQEWAPDAGIERIAKDTLRPGRRIEI
jgi:hypothetical protein